jgi:hypothetical protein
LFGEARIGDALITDEPKPQYLEVDSTPFQLPAPETGCASVMVARDGFGRCSACRFGCRQLELSYCRLRLDPDNRRADEIEALAVVAGMLLWAAIVIY